MKKQDKVIKNTKIDYDCITDSLFLYSEHKDYSFSKNIQNLVFDFNSKGEFLGLEILNASKTLKVSKEGLRSINELSLNIEVEKEVIKIELQMKYTLRNALKESVFAGEKINQGLIDPFESNFTATTATS